MCVCVCVCVRERERARERVCVWARMRSNCYLSSKLHTNKNNTGISLYQICIPK